MRQTLALTQLVVRYWARAGVPNPMQRDAGKRISGAILRFAFLALMINWGWRAGSACASAPEARRGAAVAWLLVGLGGLSTVWGAMNRGPALRGGQPPTSAPILDTLPLTDTSRVLVGLFERVAIQALVLAALWSAVPGHYFSLGVLALGIGTAGLVLGDALLRVARIVVSPIMMARASTAILALQFPFLAALGGAPILAKAPATRALVDGWALWAGEALVSGERRLPVFGAVFAVVGFSALAMRLAERHGYDRLDVVPSTKLAAAPRAKLTIIGVDGVLSAREPGGRWAPRFFFLYTLVTSVGLLTMSLTLPKFDKYVTGITMGRFVGFLAIFAGFIAAQTRAARLVTRDASARPLLAPLPILPRDLLRGKARGIIVEALVVSCPIALLLAMRISGEGRLELVWRVAFALLAVGVGASALVSIAFLTQGLGAVRAFGGSFNLETMLVAMPLFAVAAAPTWLSAVISTTMIALVAIEARRAALRRVRWMDDGDELERETPTWRALLVFASFQATHALAERALAFAPLSDAAKASFAYCSGAAVLVALTLNGVGGPIRVLPELRRSAWLGLGLVVGVVVAVCSVGYGRFLVSIGEPAPPDPMADPFTLAVTAFVAILVAPIGEETFFRGWLQKTVAVELGRFAFVAPFVVAFGFAAVRDPAWFPSHFVLGSAAGLIAARSKATGPAIVLHAVHGAITTFIV